MNFHKTAKPIFDKVVRHVIKQGVRAVVEIAPEVGDKPIQRCVYRGANGTSCAVGCLIKDEDFNPAFNESSLTSYGVLGMLAKSLDMTEGDVDYLVPLLLDLQCGHDSHQATGREAELLTYFTAVAKKYDLTMPELEPA